MRAPPPKLKLPVEAPPVFKVPERTEEPSAVPVLGPNVLLMGMDGKLIKPRVTTQTRAPSGLPLDVPNRSRPGGPKVYTANQLLSETQPKRRRPKDPDALLPNGHWDFPEQMGGPEYFGFIYLIEDTLHDKFYIGCKRYRSEAKDNKGGDSGWRTYVSSSKNIAGAIAERGDKSSFRFYCLEQYKIRGTIGWAETWSLCRAEVLSNSAKWYNGLIQKVSWRVREHITERHKARLISIAGLEK